MSPRLAASATRQHLEASVARGLARALGALAQPDDDVDAGVLEVQGVGVTLRAEADDRDGLAVEEREVRVVVVEHGRGILRRTRVQAVADATIVRPGTRSRPSSPTHGA